MGKIVKGTVDQSDIADLDFVLTAEQQAEGMALLCMARPVGDVTLEAQCDWGNACLSTGWKGCAHRAPCLNISQFISSPPSLSEPVFALFFTPAHFFACAPVDQHFTWGRRESSTSIHSQGI